MNGRVWFAAGYLVTALVVEAVRRRVRKLWRRT